MRRLTLTLTGIIRINNTPSGNPRYRMLFEDGTARLTEPDTAFSYDIMQVANIGKVYDVYVVEGTGQIARMDRVR